MGGCCQPTRTSSPKNKRKEVVLLRIPGASVHLITIVGGGGEHGEAVELGKGDLSILRITDGDVPLAIVVKVDGLRWPLTKDEPVVKLDRVHYLFTLPLLPDNNHHAYGDHVSCFLNYGVSFELDAAESHRLDLLDSFLKENACLSIKTSSNNNSSSKSKSAPSSSSSSSSSSYEVYWKDYAPKMDDYNNALAKAIAGGTGEIVKGIFICSNAYATQVQKGADLMNPPVAMGNKNGMMMPNGKDTSGSKRDEYLPNKKQHGGSINQSIRRVRKLSEMTEKMSGSLLNGVLLITGSLTAPFVKSKAGKAFFAMLPGEVLLASLDALGKVLDAVEVAERRTLAATGGAVAGAVSKKFGESAGEVTEDVFATAGHAIGTVWNVFKIRKAFKPSSLPSAILNNNKNNKRRT